MVAAEQSAQFGHLLRQHRLRAGLSQEQLAERAGLSRRGISDLERGARRSPYPATVRALAACLDLSPEDRAVLVRAALDHRVPTTTDAIGAAKRQQHADGGQLPVQLTTFVGRDREVGIVHQLLTEHRLVTLTGAGGIGKTRLAIRVAADVEGSGGTAVTMVELGPLHDERLLPQALASALGISEPSGRPLLDVVISVLAERRSLLVLDNCEHLVLDCARLVDLLLRSCADLRVLSTSREPLRLDGETVWRVPPLSLPAPGGQASAIRLAESEAVRLFVQRAQTSLPEFALDDSNAAAVARVCRLLEGIPLALELAASRITILSVEQIADRMDDVLGVLASGSRIAPARQQTLRATLDWSYSLLLDPEQRLFERLSVFAGGWTLDAAEATCDDAIVASSAVLDLLAGLVSRSLVLSEPQPAGMYRYRLLEPIRQYAAEKLSRRGEVDAARQKHAEFFVALAERLQPELLGHGVNAALDRLQQEQGNLRAVFRWLIDRREAELAQRLAGALGRFWLLRAHGVEGQEWVTQTLGLETAQPRSAARASCLYALGNLLHGRGDLGEAEAANREALEIWRELGDTAGQAWALFALGSEAEMRGDYPRARELLERSVETSRAAGVVAAETNALFRLGDTAFNLGDDAAAEGFAEAALVRSTATGWTAGAMSAHRLLGELSLASGDLASAVEHLNASVAGARELKNAMLTAWALMCLGKAAIEQGDIDSALHHLCEAVELARLVGADAVLVWSLEAFAALAIRADRMVDGVKLAGAASSLRSTGPARSSARQQRWLEQYLLKARGVLGPSGVQNAFQSGQTLGRTGAIDTALKFRLTDRQHGRDGLTTREREVAALIARGLSNPQIARELVIGQRTVQTHVGNILGKLGFSSRAQIAAWATLQHVAPGRPVKQNP